MLFLLLHLAAWYTIDVSIFRALSQASPAQPVHNPYHDGPGAAGLRPSFLIAWLAREACAFPIWLFAMLGNKVSWRDDGTQYRVRRDGKVEGTTPDEPKDWIDRTGSEAFKRFKGRGSSRFERIALRGDEEQT